MTIRYGIIGAGMMGHEHIRNLALLNGADITAIADPDQGMRERASNAIAGRFGHSPKAYDQHSDLLSAGGVDALLIASPNHTHHAVLGDCLASNLPILVEKPLATDVGQAFELADAAQKRTAPVWVAMEYRYMPPVARLIRAVHDGGLGRLVRMSIIEHRFPFLAKVGDWNRFNENTGGTMVEKCCHFFDLMRLITQAEPVRLMASGGMDVNHLDETYHGRTPDIIDNAYVIVEFNNGTRAALDLCMFAEGSYYQETITAIGDRAKIEAKVPGPARFWPGNSERLSTIEHSTRADKGPIRETVDVDEKLLAAGDHHGSTFHQHERFFQMVCDGGKPEVTAKDGAVAVMMGAAAEQAIKTGEIIKF